MAPPDGNDPATSLRFLERVREQLRYWPHTLHQIDDTLDINLIEGRGKQLLYRAIHSQNLTAFAGSGLSMNYGRLSWKDWEQEQKRVVERNAKEFCQVARAAQAWNKQLRQLVRPQEGENADQVPDRMPNHFKPARVLIHGRNQIEERHRHAVWQWLRTKDKAIEHSLDQIERLQETFSLTQSDGGHFPGGEELPVKFEIAQQLHNRLKEFTGLFLPPLPTKLDAKARLEACWAGAYAPDRTSAPTEGIRLLREFCEKPPQENGNVMAKIRSTKKAFDDAFEKFDVALTRPESHLSFEDLAKALLIDECPHAFILLRQGLLKGRDLDSESDKITEMERKLFQKLETHLEIFERSNQRRDIQGIRDFPERYRVLTPFKFENFATLRKAAIGNPQTPDGWKEFWWIADNWLNKYLERVEQAGDKRIYLTPSSRFLVSVALAQCEEPFKALELSTPPDLDKMDFFANPKIDDFTSRRSLMADRFDPLTKVERDLGVRNFITTNYDFEIERYFIDQGYRVFERPATLAADAPSPADDPENFRSDNIGNLLKDQRFSPTEAHELTSFGLVDNATGANVFHLHGRATENGNLVITETDYMKLYLTQDENRDTVDEGISIAFSGAPLLFLGLGMEETDLLRPLRQFISNRDRTVGYTSIALLPADRGMAARAKFSAALFLRYGVHTIFYGSGTIRIGGYDRGIDWLFRMIQLKKAMAKVVDAWLADKPTGVRSVKGIVKTLYDEVGQIGADLKQDKQDYPAETEALNVLLGLTETTPVTGHDLAVLLANKTNGDYDISLKCCTFTPVRPRKKSPGAHQNEADATVEGERFLGFYTDLMSQLLRITVTLPSMAPANRKASLMPMKLALDGLHSAMITASLNAALEGIALGKHQWWRDWQESPPERLAEAQRAEPPEVAKEKQYVPIAAGPDDIIKVGMAFVRHRVDNVITILDETRHIVVNAADLLDPEALRTKTPARLSEPYRTRIRAYDTFVAAVACQMRHRPLEAAKRRQIITVAARRGLGKGTFMSAASSTLGMQTYKCAAWPDDKVFMAGSIFLNLGFSPEIGSTYDMLTNALINVIALLKDMARPDRPDVLDQTESKGLGVQLTSEEQESCDVQQQARAALSREIKDVSRLTAFQLLFRELRNSAEVLSAKGQRYPRVLINMAPMDLLFQSAQHPKNGEIDRFLELLFSPELADCPVDFLFLADDTNLGEPWSQSVKDDETGSVAPIHRMRLDRAFLPELAEEQIQRSLSTGQIKIDEPDAAWRDRVQRIERGLGNFPPRPFKRAAPVTPEPHYVHFTRPMNAISLLVDNFPVLATAFYLLNPPRKNGETTRPGERVSTDPDPGVWDILSMALQEGREASDKQMGKIWGKPKLPTRDDLAAARGLVAGKVQERLGQTITDHAKAVELRDNLTNDYKLALRNRLRSEANTGGSEEWRQVRRSLGNSRFSLTMLLAAAETLLIHSQGGKVAVQQAQQFVRDIVSQVHTIGRERGDQMVLDAVLAAYRRLHKIGDPDLDCELHFLILRHLGVIGTPVSGAVLVRLAEFRAYFDRIGIELDVSRRRFLVRALTVLAYRGLVFRLEPHPRLVYLHQNRTVGGWQADQEYRYGLHRVVQNFALRNLEAGTTDPMRTNSFAPSLYAVMPSSGPSLSRTSHMFLRSLMIGLSQYPDISNQDTSADPWLFTTQDTSVRVQALRSAMTLARSTFSVAVMSRMAAHKSFGDSVQKRGYLETYRVRLRWIIRMAWEISDEARRERLDTPTLPDTIRTLYRDEIVWLYNELGVISLAQGSLSDALGYLRQAAEQNEPIEGRSRHAPIFNHIDLNHGIVQLERGAFKSARTRLNRVFEATATRKWHVHWAAEGYRCVLDHLIGRREGLRERFRTVTRHFQTNNEARAAAIFLMHRGRFLVEEDPIEAQRLLKRARDLSETDGQEDVRHHIELSQIRLRLRSDPPLPLNGTEMKALQNVEVFGRRTSIWSLQADALWLRANLLLRQGETSSSGRLLIRSMAISKRHSMTLRLNNSMTSYAEILLLRGDVTGAIGMARQSLDQAKRTGYSLETPRAQAVLARCQDMPR